MPNAVKIAAFLLYPEDIEALDGLVEELRERGYHFPLEVNKSLVVRALLAWLDVSDVEEALAWYARHSDRADEAEKNRHER